MKCQQTQIAKSLRKGGTTRQGRGAFCPGGTTGWASFQRIIERAHKICDKRQLLGRLLWAWHCRNCSQRWEGNPPPLLAHSLATWAAAAAHCAALTKIWGSMKFSYYFVAANRAEVSQRMQPWTAPGSHLIVSCLWALYTQQMEAWQHKKEVSRGELQMRRGPWRPCELFHLFHWLPCISFGVKSRVIAF